jgi:hypothetical protein
MDGSACSELLISILSLPNPGHFPSLSPFSPYYHHQSRAIFCSGMAFISGRLDPVGVVLSMWGTSLAGVMWGRVELYEKGESLVRHFEVARCLR